jgi:hypothetical protein
MAGHRYPPELRERAVRMVLEHQHEYPSQWAAIISIAGKFGMTCETLRPCSSHPPHCPSQSGPEGRALPYIPIGCQHHSAERACLAGFGGQQSSSCAPASRVAYRPISRV